MIKQLLNSFIAKYRDLSVSRRSIICLSLRLREIIDLLATDKSRYFAQPRPIIANYWSKHVLFNVLLTILILQVKTPGDGRYRTHRDLTLQVANINNLSPGGPLVKV